ncbi:hypothetical protein NQ315_003220, partial [Exocentrus adspersus]
MTCYKHILMVVLLWVPGHSGIKGNEKADELARKGSSASYIGPEPAVGVSKTMVRSQEKEWVNAQHKEYWNNITRHQHGNIFIREPSAKLTRGLLTLSRNKLRVITCPQLNIAPIRLLDCTAWCRVAGFWSGIGKADQKAKKDRPVIVKFKCGEKKAFLLKNVKMFKGTKLFITKDLVATKRNLLNEAQGKLGRSK